MNFSTPGPMTQSQELPIKSLQCIHCTILLKSKAYLFEHLNKVHDYDVDSALREAGLKCAGTDNHSNCSGDDFECRHCDFKGCSLDVLNEHDKQCHTKSEDQNIEMISENPDQHSEAAEEISSVFSTSKTKCTLNSSKDLKTYKRPLQTITKYFAASSRSNGKPPGKIADSQKLLEGTKGTLFLRESPSSSNPNSSGVLKVTAKSMIDIDSGSQRYLVHDHFLITDAGPLKPKERSRETVPDAVGKRTKDRSSRSPPAKKAKSDKKKPEPEKEENTSKQQSSSNTEFSFEVSEDEGEKKLCLVNGESSEVYFCKHCDYSDRSFSCVTTHYQNDHPYVRYNPAYIQYPSDDSATFRCLQCPVEFVSVADLKRHYTENHPEALDVFSMKSRELSLVYKCFVCSFTTNVFKALKRHHKEHHPTYKVDNSLMYYKYSATSEKAPSPERREGISPACTPRKDVKNTPSAQPPNSTAADVVLYHCNCCIFSHKSVVVMHVHYQKCHPGKEVTIDKIKQSARVTSQTTSQMTPDKSPNSLTITKSAPQTNAPDSSKKTKDKAELSQHGRHKPEASHSESPKTKKVESEEDKKEGKRLSTKRNTEKSTGTDSLLCSSPDQLLYCQFCSYSSTNIKSVLGHQNIKHAMEPLAGMNELLLYSAEVRKMKLQSEAEASKSKPKPSGSKTSKKDEVCSAKELQHKEDETADASEPQLNAYAYAEKLFYCQTCNYANPALQGVINHQAKLHRGVMYSREGIIEHTALTREEVEKSKSEAKDSPFSTHLPLPLMNVGDKDKLFCHFCNYRHKSMEYIVKHYWNKHRGFVVKGEQIRQYSAMVHEEVKKRPPKTSQAGMVNKKKKKFGKSSSVSAPPSTTASQTQRTIQCYRCSYSTESVLLLKRHLWTIHKANRSVSEVLRVCFKQGTLQTGYHCDVCLFSHEKAEMVHKHYQEQHPKRKPSLEYVTTRLYVGPESCPPKRKKKKRPKKLTDCNSDDDGADGSVLSERSGQNETNIYPCRACSFKGSSKSGLTRHYLAVHPWAMKEDGSVLDMDNSKRPSANRQVEDHDDMPGSFEPYQVPLEFDKSPGSFPMVFCPYCPARFNTQRGLNTHVGMKHQEVETEHLDEQQDKVQTRIHVFKCPHCTYVNTNYQGVLTHCQMKHPALDSRADSHHVDEEDSDNWGDCLKTKGRGSIWRLRGYMCETCPQICATLEKLNNHCKKEHTGTVAHTVPKMVNPAPKLSSWSKKMTLSNRGSVSHASLLSKKVYAKVKCQYCLYCCSTKIALSRHMQVHHKNAPVSKDLECEHKCVLCSNSYVKKKRLGSHYIKKHGKDSFLKYFAPVYKKVHEKPEAASPDCPLTQQPGNTHDECTSSMTTEENKKMVYMCPSCPYVNASYHGTLTHCQMKHPDVIARADELQTGEILVTNMVGCTFGKGANERGYMCKICPLIYVSLKKLRSHCERDHGQAEPPASEHPADVKTEKQPDHSSQGSTWKALRHKTPAKSATEISFSHNLSAPETHQSNTTSVQNNQTIYKCHICPYKGFFRRYLQCHYKKTHKLDPLTTHKLLQKYNKCKGKKPSTQESAPVNCKKCPELMFDSSQLLASHYSTFHSSDCTLDFTVLSRGTKGSTGLYRCIRCNKQMNGIRKLSYHLDCHRETDKKLTKAAKTAASPVITTTPERKSSKVS